MNKIVLTGLNEVIYHETLDNGLEVYIYKKEGFNKKTAYFTTKFGSNVYEFIPNGQSKVKEFTKGIAHFLEHKLFESSDNENTFTKFEKYGAYVNAYTNHYETCYYFSTSDNFKECLNLLLDFVQTPYLTDENVEKEKGIITQEIDMVNDRLMYLIYKRQLELTLKNNPNRFCTIGDKENVNKITKEDLYECYNTFYHPSNMILTISGDFDVEEILDEIKKNQNKKDYQKQEKVILPTYKEEKEVIEKEDTIYKNVVNPRFSICYKNVLGILTKEELLKEEAYLELFFDLKFGRASNFEKYLLDNKIISSSFSFDYEIFEDTVLIFFEGDVLDEEKFIIEIEKKLQDDKYDEKLFELYKKSYLASMVRMVDNTSYIAKKIFKEIIRYGEFINDAYEIFKSLSFNEFKNVISKYEFDIKTILRVKSKGE